MHVSPTRLLPTLGAFLILAAPAAAQDPTGPSGPTGPAATPTVVAPTPTPTLPLPTPTATPKPVTTPAPAKGRVAVRVLAPEKAKGVKYAVARQRVVIKGYMRPLLKGQKVTVQIKRGHKILKQQRVSVNGKGKYRLLVKPRWTGKLQVRALHRGNKLVRAAKSDLDRITVLAPKLNAGSTGPLTLLFTRQLSKMHYATGPVSTFSDAVGRAVVAYQQVNDLARTYVPTAQTIRDVLAGKGGYTVRHPNLGHHVEADLSKGIVVLIDGNKIWRIYHASPGKPSTPTILGTYHFYSKTPGTNDHGMVYSNYFIRGYAIHGYVDVPTYNASHGCLRVPIPNAIEIYNWIRIGDAITVEP